MVGKAFQHTSNKTRNTLLKIRRQKSYDVRVSGINKHNNNNNTMIRYPYHEATGGGGGGDFPKLSLSMTKSSLMLQD